ncbi:hypothetical protein [Streptomyces rishiriensis]|uniref:NAD(P)-dependent dehydrogenase (Short-subunit alcohol dehydrogenase family) n=1 Tax=Streptomyces rishiriensis TaxID=68264 RepID=A0ABU0NGU9_STRRH|nr:hypothetical protein [Streptomyces rishiriensis]MDQ0578332.1 NAD(P)-dependent dehydrogenase (short-subunit alcohol dehydrogenase family) [Streptomyces rishiriensis]
MRIWTAVPTLRLPLRPDSRWRRRALETVLLAADSGAPAALRAVARDIESQGEEEVWRAWLRLPVSGSPSRRWASPLLAELSPGSGGPVPDEVVEAAWSDWLSEHHASLWSLLERWNRAAAASDSRSSLLSRLALGDESVALEPRLFVDTAARFGHPIGERARARLLDLHDTEAVDLFCAAAVDDPEAVRFCVTHHLAPSDEVERAVFFVRTEQYEQYRALDPDGALLTLGYRGAPTEVRSALRAAMTALGDIDVLRVLAGRGSLTDDFASLSEQERAYLIRQFAGREAWAQLWQVTLLMPLAEAVETVRAFGDWRPSGEDERQVFDALRAANPRTVREHLDALTTADPWWGTPPTRILRDDLDERLISFDDLDFSPDGTQLAFVALADGSRGPEVLGSPAAVTRACAGIVDLGSGTLSQSCFSFEQPVDRVAHLGADSIAVAEQGFDRPVDRPQIHCADRSGVRTLDFATGSFAGLERIAGERAFVVATGDDKFFTCSFDGPVAELDLPDGIYFDEIVVDPDRQLIAVVDAGDLMVVQLDGAVAKRLVSDLDSWRESTVHAALSPSVLVRCAENGDLDVWREPLTSTLTPATRTVWPLEKPIGLVWSCALNRFLAVTQSHVDLLDVPQDPDSPLPEELVAERIPLVGDQEGRSFARLSPKGDVLAVSTYRDIDLYDLTALALRPLVSRPMSLMTHRDLVAMGVVSRNPDLDAEALGTLGLLRTCLEHRFRHDVGLGDTTSTAAVPDTEIELGS